MIDVFVCEGNEQQYTNLHLHDDIANVLELKISVASVGVLVCTWYYDLIFFKSKQF